MLNISKEDRLAFAKVSHDDTNKDHPKNDINENMVDDRERHVQTNDSNNGVIQHTMDKSVNKTIDTDEQQDSLNEIENWRGKIQMPKEIKTGTTTKSSTKPNYLNPCPLSLIGTLFH